MLEVKARWWPLTARSWQKENWSIPSPYTCSPHRHGSEYAPWVFNLTLGPNPVHPLKNRWLREARRLFEELIGFCQAEERTFWEFEKRFLVLLFGLGRVLTRLMLVNRHLRLDLKPYQAIAGYRLGDGYAERKLKTVFGEITYGR